MPREKHISYFLHLSIGKLLVYIRDLNAKQQLAKLRPGEYFVSKKPPLYISQLADLNPKLTNRFYDQIYDQEAAKRFGATDLKEFSYWAWRACGIADVQSILLTLKKISPKSTTMQLIKEGLALGGYDTSTDTGWYHKVLAQLITRYGVPSRTEKFIPSTLVAKRLLTKQFVISSLKNDIDGHLLLLYGFTINNQKQLSGFWYHDPNNFKKIGKSCYITKMDFEKTFSYRTITTNSINSSYQ